MRLFSRNNTCWPTPDQEKLLQAALRSPDEASPAWSWWCNRNSLDDIDYASRKILPLVYRNLYQQTDNIPHLKRLKREYRITYAENLKLFHKAKNIFDEFKKCEIGFLVLKGLPLSKIYYQDGGTRAMSDCDILIRPESFQKSVETLIKLGMKPENKINLSASVPRKKSIAFKKNEFELDLHLHMLEMYYDESDEFLWHQAQEFEFMGETVKTLNPTHMLFHIITHGLKWNPFPPIRWIADSINIFNTLGVVIDWEEFVRVAETKNLSHEMVVALNYLRRKFNAPISRAQINKLKEVQSDRFEKLDYYFKIRKIRPWEERLRLRHYLEYARDEKKDEDFPLGYLRFLEKRWNLTSLSLLPIDALKRSFCSIKSLFNNY